jgi:hypothetical protein
MYHIIGGDQQEYGPIGADQLRQWLAEGRVNAQTQIRLADSTVWQPLGACPEFAGSPPPGLLLGAPAGAAFGQNDARRLVSGPAIGLIVTGILSLAISLLSLVMHLTVVLGLRSVQAMPSPSPQFQQLFSVLNSLNGPLGLVSDAFSLTMGTLITLGAFKLKNLQSYTFAYTMSILAMIPCFSPCCLLGLPFGIWALVVLSKPEIKAQFR